MQRGELLAHRGAVLDHVVEHRQAHGGGRDVRVLEDPHQEGLVEVRLARLAELVQQADHLGVGRVLGPIGNKVAAHRLHHQHADVALVGVGEHVGHVLAVEGLGPLGQGHVVVGLEDEIHLAGVDPLAVLGRHVAAQADEADLALLAELEGRLVEGFAPAAMGEVAVDVVGVKIPQALLAAAMIKGRCPGRIGGGENDQSLRPSFQRVAQDLSVS